MSRRGPRAITIALSPAQVDLIVRAAGESSVPNVGALVGGPHVRGARGGYALTDTADPRLSRSLVRGLSLLASFDTDGAPRGIVELADDLGMSASTAHRYASTLVELGLLERCPRTRKYRPVGFQL